MVIRLLLVRESELQSDEPCEGGWKMLNSYSYLVVDTAEPCSSPTVIPQTVHAGSNGCPPACQPGLIYMPPNAYNRGVPPPLLKPGNFPSPPPPTPPY